MEAVKKMKRGSGQYAKDILDEIAAIDELQCDNCLTLLKDPVTLPCDHYFCKDCFETLMKKDGDDYVECLKCHKIAMALAKSHLLAHFCEILQKSQALGKHPVPLNGEKMEARGLRNIKRPQRYDSPEPEPVKRRKQQPEDDEITLTSAKGLGPHIELVPGASTSLRMPVGEQPPQTPNTKVDRWLKQLQIPKVSAAHIQQVNETVEQSTAPGQVMLQSDSGILTSTSPEKAAASETLAAAKAGPSGHRPQARAGPSGLQRFRSTNAERSPGWNRSKRVRKQLVGNEQTLKALDVSGGDLSKRPGSAARNRAMNASTNETAKEMPLRKVGRPSKKKKLHAETFEVVGERQKEPFETGLVGIQGVLQHSATNLLVKERPMAALETIACQKERAEAERAAFEKLKGQTKKFANGKKTADDSMTGPNKAQTEAEMDISNPVQAKSLGDIQKIAPKKPKSDDQGKAKAAHFKVTEEKGPTDHLVKALDVSGGKLSKRRGRPLRNRTLIRGGNETVKEMPLMKAVRRLPTNKSEAETFECVGETQAEQFETDFEAIHQEIGQANTKLPAEEMCRAALETTAKERAEDPRAARDKLNGQASKVTQTDVPTVVLGKKPEHFSKPVQEKVMADIKKTPLEKPRADDAQEKTKADPNEAAEKKVLLKSSASNEKKRLHKAKAEELRVAQEKAIAETKKVIIQKAPEIVEMAAQVKFKSNTVELETKKVVAVAASSSQVAVTSNAKNAAKDFATVGNGNSVNKKTEPKQNGPLHRIEVTARLNMVSSRSGETALKKSRKTFSLEADTQDLACMIVNEEDSFNTRIQEIAEANKSLKTPSDNISKDLMNVKNSPIKPKLKTVPSQDEIEIHNSPKSSKDMSDNSSDEELLKQIGCVVLKKQAPADNCNLNFNQTEFRELRSFFLAYKGPFESETGEPLRGKLFFGETNPRCVATEVKGPDETRACSCKSALLRKKSMPTQADGSNEISSNESDQSMAVNCTSLTTLAPKSQAVFQSQNQPMVLNNQTLCSPLVESDQLVVNDIQIPEDKTTQPVEELEYNTFDTALSSYDTALESFGVVRDSNIRCTQSASQVPVTFRASIGAGNQTLSQGKQTFPNVRMGMHREVDSFPQNIKEKLVVGKSSNLSKPKATNKPASAKLLEPEPDVSDNDFIPDTIPNHEQVVHKRITKGPLPVKEVPPAVKLVPNQNADEGMSVSQPPKMIFLTQALQPELQPSRVTQTEIQTKTNQANDRTLYKSQIKPCPKSRKPSFKTTSSQAIIPRLTDPTALGSQCLNESKIAREKNFKRIRAQLSESETSESECNVQGTVVISSSEDDDDLPNRMSDSEDPDSLNNLLDEHCRNIHSSRRKSSAAGEMGPSYQVPAREALPQMQADICPATSKSFVDGQQMLAPRARAVAESNLNLGDDVTHHDDDSDNDITHVEEFPEQLCQAEDDGGEDYSEDIVKLTPEPKSFRRGPLRQLPANFVPEKPVCEGRAPDTDLKAVHIISSGLSTEDTKKLLLMIKTVGATYDTEFSEQTTHLVAHTNVNGTAPRTAKLMMAIAKGAWAVSMSWVHKCYIMRSLQPADDFEVKDGVFNDSPCRSRLDCKRLFTDFAFFVMLPYSGPIELDSYKLILQLAGGAVVDNDSDKAGKKYLITLTELEDSSQQRSMNEDYMNTRKSLMLAYSWIHTSICSFSLRPVWTHMPRNTCLSPIIRSSYPMQMFGDSSTSDEESNSSDDEP